MPRVVRMFGKSKGALKHNMGPRPPKVKESKPKKPRASQIDCSKLEIGSEAWENCMRRKRQRLAEDIKD